MRFPKCNAIERYQCMNHPRSDRKRCEEKLSNDINKAIDLFTKRKEFWRTKGGDYDKDAMWIALRFVNPKILENRFFNKTELLQVMMKAVDTREEIIEVQKHTSELCEKIDFFQNCCLSKLALTSQKAFEESVLCNLFSIDEQYQFTCLFSRLQRLKHSDNTTKDDKRKSLLQKHAHKPLYSLLLARLLQNPEFRHIPEWCTCSYTQLQRKKQCFIYSNQELCQRPHVVITYGVEALRQCGHFSLLPTRFVCILPLEIVDYSVDLNISVYEGNTVKATILMNVPFILSQEDSSDIQVPYTPQLSRSEILQLIERCKLQHHSTKPVLAVAPLDVRKEACEFAIYEFLRDAIISEISVKQPITIYTVSENRILCI